MRSLPDFRRMFRAYSDVILVADGVEFHAHAICCCRRFVCFAARGCAVAALGTAGAVGVAAAQEKSLGEAVDDATASNEIKSKLLSESANKFGEVDVEVTGDSSCSPAA